MNKPVLVDLRNIYKADDIRARGFAYTSVGRG
jgi:UDPglucose 6-dehydrogenase